MDSFLSEVTHLKAGKPVPANSRLLCLAPEFDCTTQLVRVRGHHPGPERVFAEVQQKVACRSENKWGILFKCMTSRAVYTDLYTSLDSDSFLRALSRFTARHGKPHESLCDQGTNFQGGEKKLQEAFAALQPDLQAQLASQQIRFSFNSANAPHFGRCWEREIRSFKTALRVILGVQTFMEEGPSTVPIEIEVILNSKPQSTTYLASMPVIPQCYYIKFHLGLHPSSRCQK
ncbi:hypothetical protein SRHO_G00071460 [Serrasalmus rhombeus]